MRRREGVVFSCAAAAALSGGVFAAAVCPAAAQGPAPAPAAAGAFPDVPENHWAYEAVRDLANRGYVKGYPDGKFLGKNAMTRFEFATVIARMLQTVDTLAKQAEAASAAAQKPSEAPETPNGTPVTQDDLNKIQTLVDSFRQQLEAIGTPIEPVQDQIDAIRQELSDLRDLVRDTRSTSYGFGDRRFRITGYVQARVQTADSKDDVRFPQGVPNNSGASQYNGNYEQGGNPDSFVLRRNRFKITGGVTDRTSFGIQIDAGGFTTRNDAPNNVTVREGYVSYVTGDPANRFPDPDRTPKSPVVTAGLFANYFGYQLPESSSNILQPERPLAFNEGGSGLWIAQDYDRGAQVSYAFSPGDGKWGGYRAVAGLVNGTGLNTNNNKRDFDQVYRLLFQSWGRINGISRAQIGVSYYDGSFPRPSYTTTANGQTTTVTFTGANYQSGKKQLYGIDLHYISPKGPFVFGEYVAGKFEERTYFNPSANSPTTLVQNQYAPGNKVEGYYLQTGYTFNPRGTYPLTLGFNYDVFRRSKSGVDTNVAGVGGGPSGGSFDDKNYGFGVLYNLDRQTRLRLWYVKPDKVAHAAGTEEPPKIGLYTAELQVKF